MNRLHLLSLLFVFGLGTSAFADDVEVTVGILNLRSTPNGKKLRSLPKGQKLEVIGSARNGSWLKVKAGNTTGYVFKRYTRPSATTTTPGELHTVDTTGGLNIRSSASGRARKIGALDPGTEVEVLETKGNWRRIKAKVNGRTVTGWVYGRYLKKKQRTGMSQAVSGALSGREEGEAGEATETPAAGATETPAAGATETPAAGATETPAAGATETPAAGATETPAAGATETPAAGATETPAAGTPAAGTPATGTPATGTPTTGTPAAGTTAAGVTDAGAADAVETSDASSMSLSKKQVTASSLNVRAEPSTSAQKIGSVSRGEEVDVLELQGDWSRIRKGSLTGWVASRYLVEPGSVGNGDVRYGRYRVSDPLVRQVLEKIAARTGRTVIVTSGDRNYVPRGGSRTSLHLLRRAADFKVQGMSLSAVFDLIRSNRSTILSGAGFEVIYHQPGTNTGGPHLHVGRRGSSSDSLKTERGGRYRRVN